MQEISENMQKMFFLFFIFFLKLMKQEFSSLNLKITKACTKSKICCAMSKFCDSEV